MTNLLGMRIGFSFEQMQSGISATTYGATMSTTDWIIREQFPCHYDVLCINASNFGNKAQTCLKTSDLSINMIYMSHESSSPHPWELLKNSSEFKYVWVYKLHYCYSYKNILVVWFFRSFEIFIHYLNSIIIVYYYRVPT